MAAHSGEALSDYLDESDHQWYAEEKEPQLRRVRLRREALTSQLQRLAVVCVVAVLATALVLFLPWGRIDPAVADGRGAWFGYLVAALALLVALQLAFVARDHRRYRRELQVSALHRPEDAP